MRRLYTSMRAVQFLCSYSDSGNQLHFSKAEFVGNANTYLPYFSIRPIPEQYCDYNNNDDGLGLSRYLGVKSSINPSIHQTIFWISKRHNTSLFKSLRSSRTRPDDKLAHTNERTNRARKQASKQGSTYNIKKKNEKQRPTGRPFISEYS